MRLVPRKACATIVLTLVAAVGTLPTARADDPGASAIVGSEFIYDSAPFPQCHASTIAQAGPTLVAAWFGGSAEGKPDVGIWGARKEGKSWSEPVEVLKGTHDGQTYPCWNPVLFQPKVGPLLLFSKVGPSPSRWWGVRMTSTDAGKTWSAPERLPSGIAGPIKNKPVQLANGELLCPSSTEDQGWRVHFERTSDLGVTWQRTPPINDGKTLGAIQPSILIHPAGRLQALCRATGSSILQTWSSDEGKTWSPLTPLELPNPNSGIDAVTLADGRHLLVYNHTVRGRNPLNVAVSSDGKTWQAALVLESQKGEYSYPAVIQTSDGLVHITYTWKRQKVRHITVDPARLVLREMPGGRWPASSAPGQPN